MEILQGFVDAVNGILQSSGIFTLNWQNYVMIGVSIVLLYLAIKKQYEPLLLLPIAFGMLLVNLYPQIMAAPSTDMIPMTDYLQTHPGTVESAIQYPITTLDGVNDEVVAVISAAVAAMYGSSGKARIKSIKKSDTGRSAWANAGLLDNTRPF